MNENRKIFTEQFPDLDYSEITIMLEDMWEVLDEDAHKYYEEQAK